MSGEIVHSSGVITGPPNELVAPIHDRMPVILLPAARRTWLGEEAASEEELRALLTVYPAALMRAWPVGIRVGNVRNNDTGLIEPLARAS